MSKLDKLEQLADAASVVDHNENCRWYSESELTQHVHYAKNSRLIAACDPQTIKQIAALLNQSKNALKEVIVHHHYESGTPVDAFLAIESFEKDEP